jgi:ribosomal-protein-alanine N-acetyltransferase
LIANTGIRLATRAEAQKIAELSRVAIEYGLPWSWTPERVARSVADRATNVVVADAHGGLAGFAIMKYGDTTAHLLLLAVPEALRRRGIGSALLGWLEETARAAGIETVRAEVRLANPAARAFYRGNGYEEIDRITRYYQGREDALRLEKVLALHGSP